MFVTYFKHRYINLGFSKDIVYGVKLWSYNQHRNITFEYQFYNDRIFDVLRLC